MTLLIVLIVSLTLNIFLGLQWWRANKAKVEAIAAKAEAQVAACAAEAEAKAGLRSIDGKK
jgi:hypothetical protein